MRVNLLLLGYLKPFQEKMSRVKTATLYSMPLFLSLILPDASQLMRRNVNSVARGGKDKRFHDPSLRGRSSVVCH